MSERKDKHLTFRVCASLLVKLDKAATKASLNRTDFVVKALKEKLKQGDIKR